MRNFLDEVRKTPFEKVSYLKKIEKMTIDAYIRDICDAFGVEPAKTPYDDPREVLQNDKKDSKKDKEKKNQ